MTDLAERYGVVSTQRRRTVGVVGVALVLAVVAVVTWAFVDRADPDVRSRLLRYEVVSAHEVTADLTVVRDSTDVVATCELRALAEDHSVVGEITQRVDSGPAEQTFAVRLRTEREAVSVVSDGCTTPDQPRPR